MIGTPCPPRSPSDPVAEDILDAAERLFARYGFRKTSIEDIARAARIGKGSVYLHFESKQAILTEVVTRVADGVFEALTEAVRRARSPAGKLRAFVDAKLSSLTNGGPEDALHAEATWELLPAASAHLVAHDARERALLTALLRDGVEAGAFVVDRPERVAAALTAWLAALDTSPATRRGDPAVRAGAEELVAVLLRGLAVAPTLHSS